MLDEWSNATGEKRSDNAVSSGGGIGDGQLTVKSQNDDAQVGDKNVLESIFIY